MTGLRQMMLQNSWAYRKEHLLSGGAQSDTQFRFIRSERMFFTKLPTLSLSLSQPEFPGKVTPVLPGYLFQ